MSNNEMMVRPEIKAAAQVMRRTRDRMDTQTTKDLVHILKAGRQDLYDQINSLPVGPERTSLRNELHRAIELTAQRIQKEIAASVHRKMVDGFGKHYSDVQARLAYEDWYQIEQDGEVSMLRHAKDIGCTTSTFADAIYYHRMEEAWDGETKTTT